MVFEEKVGGRSGCDTVACQEYPSEKISGGQDWQFKIIGVMLGKGELGSLNHLSARVSKGDEGTGLMLFCISVRCRY